MVAGRRRQLAAGPRNRAGLVARRMNRRPAEAGYRPAARDPGPRERQMSVQPPPRRGAPARATPVRRVLEDLHGRIRRDPPSGEVASYIPELSRADPETFGIALATVHGDVLRGRATPGSSSRSSRSPSRRLRHGAGGARRRGRAPRRRRRADRRGVQLDQPRRARHAAQPDGQRGGDRHGRPDRGRHARRARRADARDLRALRRPAGADRRRGLPLRERDRPSQPRHRPPDAQLRPSPATRTRCWTSTSASARSW